jgi:hypothetical protein
MSDSPSPDKLTDEQIDAINAAAYSIIKARKEAVAMLARSGVEHPPEMGWFGSPCGAQLPSPPANHYCGCRDYTGDGGICLTTYLDFTGPDFGGGPPRRTCRHRPYQHRQT